MGCPSRWGVLGTRRAGRLDTSTVSNIHIPSFASRGGGPGDATAIGLCAPGGSDKRSRVFSIRTPDQMVARVALSIPPVMSQSRAGRPQSLRDRVKICPAWRTVWTTRKATISRPLINAVKAEGSVPVSDCRQAFGFTAVYRVGICGGSQPTLSAALAAAQRDAAVVGTTS